MRFFRPFSGIKAITFDLDDTLYNNDPIIRQAESGLQSFLHQHYPKAANLSFAKRMSIRRNLIEKDNRLASDMGELRLQTLELMLKDDISHHDQRHQAAEKCFEYFYQLRSQFVVSEQISSTLQKLAERVPLVAITNGNVDVEKIGLSPIFAHVYHANMEYTAKPHPDMFTHAQKTLALSADTILHVGDGMKNDVLGAYRCGYKTAWYAANRPMNLNAEPVKVIPDLVLGSLDDLLSIVD